MYLDQHISVVIPAYNEELSVARVIRELWALQHAGQRIVDHIVVCDNASTDATAAQANAAGAAVVYQSRRGYGSACQRGIAHLPATDIVLFVDADHSVDLEATEQLLACLLQGAHLAIGSRSLGHIPRGALTPQQVWGNRLVTFLMRRLWDTPVTDLGPFRAIRPHTLQKLNMRDGAYGWTVEMQAKVLSLGMIVKEVPVNSLVRIGKSKISGTWRGTFGAMSGILSTLATIAWRNRRRRSNSKRNLAAATKPPPATSLASSEKIH